MGERCLECHATRTQWGSCQDPECFETFGLCAKIDRKRLAQAETFVRGILEETFGQKTTDRQVKDIALKLVRLLPEAARDRPPKTHA